MSKFTVREDRTTIWARAKASGGIAAAVNQAGSLAILWGDGTSSRIKLRERPSMDWPRQPLYELVSEQDGGFSILASGDLPEMNVLFDALCKLACPSDMVSFVPGHTARAFCLGAAFLVAALTVVAVNHPPGGARPFQEPTANSNVTMLPLLQGLRVDVDKIMHGAVAPLPPGTPATIRAPQPIPQALQVGQAQPPAANPPVPMQALSRPLGDPVSLDGPTTSVQRPAATVISPNQDRSAPLNIIPAPTNSLPTTRPAAVEAPSPEATPSPDAAAANPTGSPTPDSQKLFETLRKIREATETGQQITPAMLAALPKSLADRLQKAAEDKPGAPSTVNRNQTDDTLPAEAIERAGRDPWDTPDVPDHDTWTKSGGMLHLPLPQGGNVKRPDDLKLFGLQ